VTHPLRLIVIVLGAIAAVAVALVLVLVLSSAKSSHAGGDPPIAKQAEAVPAPVAVKPGAVQTLGGPVGRRIAPGFLGLSIEFQAIRAYTGPDPEAINPLLVQLIRNISPGQQPVIRIGGDSTDASWVPAPGLNPPPQVTYALTPSWFATTAALAAQTRAKLIFGLNLGADQPALAAAEARRAVQAFGSSLAQFEIGNEPNVYDVIAAYHTASGGPVLTRAAGYGYPKYIAEFRATAARLPSLPLAGPALAAGPTPARDSWGLSLGTFLASERQVQTLTVHRYPLRNCFVGPGSQQYPTVAHLLSSYATTTLAAGVRRYVQIAHAAGRKLRIDELNSVACRGRAGVSNTFASSLWVLDALFSLARAGVDGVNMHTLPRSAYQLFSFSHRGGKWSASVAPVYYGLDMFARAAPAGSQILRVLGGHRPPGVAVWATRGPSGQVRTVIVNEDVKHGAVIGLRAPAGAGGEASLIRMTARGANARGGVAIGGAGFGAQTSSGLLVPARSTAVTPSRRGVYGFRVPAASAALITFARR
jgi:hypothetical protein